MPSTCRPVSLVLVVLIVTSLAALPKLGAAELDLALVAPASQGPLNVAVPIESSAELDASSSWQLVEVGPPGVTVPVQLAHGVSGDGSADEKSTRLVAVIPPGVSLCSAATGWP